MGAKSGFALKFLQWLLRGIQFCCCALILALFSYFLAAATRNNIQVPTWVRAVEGISGVGVVYTLLGLLLLCCLAGHPFSSFIAIVLDIAFAGAFIYVAQANRTGAGSCPSRDRITDTPFGDGSNQDTPEGLPSWKQICQMENAVFAVSIVAIAFSILSALMEVVLVRHRRKEQRFGPSPANNYTSGYGSERKRRGIFGLFRRKKGTDEENANELPQHPAPNDMRASYNTEATAVDPHGTGAYNKYGSDSGHGSSNGGFRHDGDVAYPDQQPVNPYRPYGDGTFTR